MSLNVSNLSVAMLNKSEAISVLLRLLVASANAAKRRSTSFEEPTFAQVNP